MNFNKLLGGLALTAMLGAGLSSCSNDMDDYRVSNSLKTIVNKAPKIKAYSGDQIWGNTNGLAGTTRANEGSILSVSTITTQEFIRSGVGSEEEYINNYLPENEDNISKVNLDFLFHTTGDTKVELFPVFAQSSKIHDFGIFYYDAQGDLQEEIIWEDLNPNQVYDWTGALTGIEITIPADIYFGFFIDKGNELYLVDSEDPYNTNKVGRLYSSPSLNPASYPTYGNGNWSANRDADPISTHAVTWVREYDNGKTRNYIGFEDWADFDYQDLVFTMTPEVERVKASWFENNKDNECPKCRHNSHLPGTCPDCNNPDDGCFEDSSPDTPVTPEEPTTPPVVNGDDHTNEVEVNLGVDTKGETSNGKYNESHLSIHVRSAVDVDMFIPMPLDMICPADDMEIVKKHLDGEMVHGGEFQGEYDVDEDGKAIMQGGLLSKMTYRIADRWDVSIYVEYVANPEEGIHIWTEGLKDNTDLFEYLQNEYGDGITFEIWNYYNKDASWSDLKKHLDKATIEFIGNTLPDFFINAFGDENYQQGPNGGKDCNVSLVEDQADNYDYNGEGPHLNASEHNKIYENKNRVQNNSAETNSEP